MTNLEKMMKLREQLFQRTEKEKEKGFKDFLNDASTKDFEYEGMFEELKVLRGR